MKNFIQRYRNAKTAIAQIRRGEWTPHYNPRSRKHLTATRDGLEMWIGNGAWWCEIIGGQSDYFGMVWRHYVWWAAARQMKAKAERQYVRDSGAPVL